MKTSRDFGLIFWAHLSLIVIAYLSPFLFRWQLILAGVSLLFIQQVVFEGCLLTHAQFGKDKYMTFYYRYITLAGFSVNKKKLKLFMAWIMPLLVLAFALFWQVVWEMEPIIW